MNHLRKFLVWQKGINIVSLVYKIVADSPKEEKYGLARQICRAAVSISSSIVGKTIKIIPEEKFQEITQKIYKEQKILSSFMQTLTT